MHRLYQIRNFIAYVVVTCTVSKLFQFTPIFKLLLAEVDEVLIILCHVHSCTVSQRLKRHYFTFANQVL